MEKIKFKYNHRYLWILVMLSMTFTLFNHLPIFQKHYFFLMLGFALMFFYARGLFQTNYFVAVIAHMLIITFDYFVGDVFYSSPNMIVKEAIMFVFPLGMYYSLRKHCDRSLFHLMLLVFGVFLIESTIIAAIANYQYPGIIRYLASAEDLNENSQILLPFQKLGITDYAMPHALPVLIPGLVYGVRNTKGFYKRVCIALIVTAFVLAYVSNSSTALIMTVLVFIFSILINPKKSSKTIFALFVLFLIITPVLTNKDVQVGFLEGLNSIVPEDANIHRKIDDIEASIMYDDAEGTVGNRTVLYDLSLNEFKKHPLLGTSELVGGHSSIFDRLATLGILGMIPFALFWVLFSKSVLRSLPQDRHFYYLLSLFSALVMLTSKNAMSWAMWLCVLFLLPGMLLFIGNDNYIYRGRTTL